MFKCSPHCLNAAALISCSACNYYIRWANFRFKFKTSIILYIFFTERNELRAILKKKSSFRMKVIFILVDTIISKITIFVVQNIYTWSCRSHSTHYEGLFGVACVAQASVDHISVCLEMRDTYHTIIITYIASNILRPFN